MNGWTDDLSVKLPPGRTVAELVDVILRSALGGVPYEEIDSLLRTEFELSADDAELAWDRCFGGLVRAGTRNTLNCPPPDKDPVAWESFQRGWRDASLLASIYPDMAPKQAASTPLASARRLGWRRYWPFRNKVCAGHRQ